MSSDKSAKAISGSIIQNSAKCLEVLLFSARNVGPVQSNNVFMETSVDMLIAQWVFSKLLSLNYPYSHWCHYD